MPLDGYESDESDIVCSPESLFSILSDGSCNTLVASDDELWGEKTDKETLEETAPEVLVSGTNNASADHVGPLDASHPGERDSLATTDDGFFVEMEDALPDWRSTCSSLSFATPSVHQLASAEEEAEFEESVANEDYLPLQYSILPPALVSKIRITEKMYAEALSSSTIMCTSCSEDSLDESLLRRPAKEVRKHSVKITLTKVKNLAVKKFKRIFAGSRRA